MQLSVARKGSFAIRHCAHVLVNEVGMTRCPPLHILECHDRLRKQIYINESNAMVDDTMLLNKNTTMAD